MLLNKLTKIAALGLLVVSQSAWVHSSGRDTIQIAGSSTVLPFASIAAEDFGNNFPQFKTPVVGSGGTGGGFRQFCQGIGANTIDIANASRAIRPAELAVCSENGVKKIIEVRFGYDGIVFASSSEAGDFKLEPKHVFLAQAAEVPKDGKWVKNPFKRWSEIDKSLPNQAISLAIPGSNHGTREVYEERVITAGCMSFAETKAMTKDDAAQKCVAMRNDGRVVEIAGDYTETLARLEAQKDTLGVFGLSFYEANRDRLKVATVSGVVPTMETILAGEYPVARPLFFYVKGEHIGLIPGLKEFAQYFINAQVSGDGSPLEEAGLIPLSDKDRASVTKAISEGKTL